MDQVKVAAAAIETATKAVNDACDALDDAVRPLLPQGWDVEVSPEIDPDEDVYWLRLLRLDGSRTRNRRVQVRCDAVFIGDVALADWVAQEVLNG